jgi:hypothetical protein
MLMSENIPPEPQSELLDEAKPWPGFRVNSKFWEKNVKTKHNGRVFVASKKQNRFLPPSNAGSLETWQDLLILLVLSWVCCKSPSSKPKRSDRGVPPKLIHTQTPS